MSYAKLTVNNPSFIKRFTHLKRFEVVNKILNTIPHNTILDFGTGDGYLLQYLSNNNTTVSYSGYDPDPLNYIYKELENTVNKINKDSINIHKSLETLNGKTFDVICCLEVLEHFSEKNQRIRLTEIISLLHKDSKVIISVPVEIGITALFKNSIRYILKQSQAKSSFKNIFKSFLGKKIPRHEEGYITTHIGFNHKELEALLKSMNFKITQKTYSPFPILKGLLNSQVFYVLELNSES